MSWRRRRIVRDDPHRRAEEIPDVSDSFKTRSSRAAWMLADPERRNLSER